MPPTTLQAAHGPADGDAGRSDSGAIPPLPPLHDIPALRVAHPGTVPALDRVTRLAARALGARTSLLTLVDPERQRFVSQVGLPPAWARRGESPLSHSFCQHVVRTGRPVRIDDVAQHPEHLSNRAVRDFGLRTYLGVPFRSPDGEVIGALCAASHEAREWTEDDRLLLEDLSEAATSELARSRSDRSHAEAVALAGRQSAMVRAFFDTVPLMMGVAEVLDHDILHHIDNAATATFYGTTPEAMRGRLATELGADATSIGRWLAAYERAIETGQPAVFDYEHPAPAGARTLSATVAVVGRSDTGRPLCSYVVEDVTDARQKSRALQESADTLRLALDSAHMGAWAVNLQSRVLELSPRMRQLHGLERSENRSDVMLDIIHDDDRETVRTTFRDGMTAVSNGAHGADVTVEYRARIAGEIRWFRASGRVYPGRSGAPERIVGATFDITDEKRYAAALDEARAQAEEARREAEALARLKTNVLQTLSHEIRTPLTAVIGFADVLAGELEGTPEHDLVAHVQGAADQLLTVLNSVLDHARLEAGFGSEATQLEVHALDVREPARSVASLFESWAQDKGVRLLYDPPAAPVTAMANAGALQRVLGNLVSNAVKFTDDGVVRLRVRPSGERVLLSVEDTGTGMSAEFLERAFEPFHRESSGHGRKQPGTGLGLAIVRRLVELMGGTIRVQSEREVGTAFHIALPAA